MARKGNTARRLVPTTPAVDDRFFEIASSLRNLWNGALRESFAFWMLCGYLVVEYVRPQSIMPSLDFLPWGKVALLLAMVGLLLEKKARFVSDPANLLMTMFLLTLVASSTLAVYPDISWDHWFNFFGWYVIYFLVVNILTNERRFVIFLVLFLLASFKLSFFGARTWAFRGFSFTNWGIMGPSGPFQNSGELSVQMLMFGPVAYQYALYLRPHVSRAVFLALLFVPVTAAMTVIGASSRGAQLALAYQSYRVMLKGKLTLRSLFAAGAVVALVIALFPQEQIDRFRSAGDDTTSMQRILYWKRGAEMIAENPVLGVGYFNFPQYFADHYPGDILVGVAQLPHNILIQIGTDAGFIGLTLFAALVIRSFQCCRQIQKASSRASEAMFATSIAKGLSVSLWGFLIAGQFVTIAYYPFFWINLALSVALLNIVRRQQKPISSATT